MYNFCFQVRSQWRLISELIQLLQLLSVINIVQLKQWNRLFCYILNFGLSLGIFLSDQTVSLSGQVWSLTWQRTCLLKKNICSLEMCISPSPTAICPQGHFSLADNLYIYSCPDLCTAANFFCPQGSCWGSRRGSTVWN